VLTDGAKAVVWDADYRPFGAATVTGALAFNLRFPGQYYDDETGLHYNYFRDYDPATGRYIQSDPIGLQGGWNSYGYVSGNPVMRVDPSGLICWHVPKPVGGIYCDGFFDDWPRRFPPIPICCDKEQLQTCRLLSGASVLLSCSLCAETEGAAIPACALCAAETVNFLIICPNQNCTICEPPDRLSCNPAGSAKTG